MDRRYLVDAYRAVHYDIMRDLQKELLIANNTIKQLRDERQEMQNTIENYKTKIEECEGIIHHQRDIINGFTGNDGWEISGEEEEING